MAVASKIKPYDGQTGSASLDEVLEALADDLIELRRTWDQKPRGGYRGMPRNSKAARLTLEGATGFAGGWPTAYVRLLVMVTPILVARAKAEEASK